MLAMGSPEEVKEATRQVIKKVGRDGGLMVSGGCIIPAIYLPAGKHPSQGGNCKDLWIAWHQGFLSFHWQYIYHQS